MAKKTWIRIDNNSVVVDFRELQDLQDAIEIMKEKGLTNCKIYLNSRKTGHGDELSFVDNVSYLEEIAKLGFNINFYYSSNLEHAIPLKKVIEDEKRLDLMCKEIKNSNLSPLEKFVAVYDIVHFFKPYKEENEEEMSPTLSRNLYEYLNNDYMVCAGYADLLENLCKRVGIPCAYFDLDPIDKGNNVGHARNYVYINDPKYNIQGFYISDATQQENIKTIAGFPITNYKNILITTKEQQDENNYKPTDYFRIFNYSKEDFLKLIERNGGNYIKFLVAFDIKKLDVAFGMELYNMDFDNPSDVEKAWDYISSKINKPISNEILLSALMESKQVLYPNVSDNTLSDLKSFYSREMGIKQENLNVSKMTLKEIKLQYPIYYDSKIFYVINTEVQNHCDNLSIFWNKEIERLSAFGFATSKIQANQDKIINQGYQIDFNERGQINIQFPPLSNNEDISLEEYIPLLNKQIQDFSTMISSLSQENNKASMRNDEVETQENIHAEKENVNTRISLWKRIKTLFVGKKNKKQEELKQIEVPKPETPKTNDTEHNETINTQQHVTANSYLGNSENKTNEMHDEGYAPVNIDEMSKEQLEVLKRQLEEEYSVDKPQGFGR